MSRSVEVPDEIYERAAKMAADRHVPLEDFVLSALVDQMAAHGVIARRAARSSEEAFHRALGQIPDVDRLSPE